MNKKLLVVIPLILLTVTPAFAKPVQSWDNSHKVNWEYLNDFFLPLYWLFWNAERGAGYRGYLDLNRDGSINILDAGTLNWIIVKALEY